MDETFTTIANAQNEAVARGVLNIWTVYDHPSDFPNSYVARRFEVGSEGPMATTDTVQGELRIIRESFRHCGLTCLNRQEGDEAHIVECWL